LLQRRRRVKELLAPLKLVDRVLAVAGIGELHALLAERARGAHVGRVRLFLSRGSERRERDESRNGKGKAQVAHAAEPTPASGGSVPEIGLFAAFFAGFSILLGL